MAKILSVICICILSMSLSITIAAVEFHFDNGEKDSWGMWGQGTIGSIKTIGAAKLGCARLECMTGQEVTMHKKIAVPEGRYLVTAKVRAFDIGVGQWNYSGWIFYKEGDKTKTAVKDLRGTFEWSEISFTVDSKGDGFDIWFRLKAQGTLWIDDITINAHAGEAQAYAMKKSTKSFPKPNKVGEGQRCDSCYRWSPKGDASCILCGKELSTDSGPSAVSTEGAQEKLLVGFEEDQHEAESKRHYINGRKTGNATQGKRTGVIAYAQYNNFKISDETMKDWSGYDYLAMDVFNPTQQNIPFSVVINDEAGNTGGYWNQLNHASTIAPGWNKLRFHVNRYVGERGSVRFQRYLDLKKIRKMWIAVACESKKGIKGEFLIDNIRLLKAPNPPQRFAGLQLFDFVDNDAFTQRGFIGIKTKHSYHQDVGFGYHNVQVWRSHDSAYADSLHRDGHFVNSGEFRVDVPNGTYHVRLVPFHLGEWSEHFWMQRSIIIEGQTVLDEKRSTAAEYSRGLLRFADIEPTPTDTAFDLYLEKVFKPLTCDVEVSDGQLNIVFKGDNSAICMNSLIIYPVAQKSQGENFVHAMNAVRADDFKNICVQLPTIEKNEIGEFSATDKANGFYAALIDSFEQVRYNQILKGTATEIQLQGGIGQRPVQAITVRNLKDDAIVTMKTSPLKSRAGKIIQPQAEWLRYAVSQYQSHSFNHETFELAPRFLRNFTDKGMVAPKDGSVLIWYQVPINKSYAAGVYTGSVSLTLNGKSVRYPVSLTVHDYALPELDTALGWFGIDALDYGYFKGSGIKEAVRANREAVLRVLSERGFSTFSGVPGFTYAKSGAALTLEASEVDAVMKTARELGFNKKVFTYGGAFSNRLYLDKSSGEIEGLAYEDFRKQSSAVLKKHMKDNNWLPIVVDFSDEASGYSQKVDRDLKRSAILETYYPYFRRGGFTHSIEKGAYGHDLNQKFTDVSISYNTPEYRDAIKKAGNRWGHYNMAMGLFTNDREIGLSLYGKSKYGCDHHLGWYMTLSQNYPYYDLDGRENDAMMVFPRTDGGLDMALKLEWACQGIEDYRLLLLLESLIKKGGAKAQAAADWIKTYQVDNIVRRGEGVTHPASVYHDFRNVIYGHILSLNK
ncbi:MAG: hypothetical protein HRU15_17440 [Planctomycetes bacterium]|nr:hypothetical protein [Planctomycetota bacterium]